MMNLCIYDLKEKINIGFISNLILFHLEETDFLTRYILQGVTLINSQYLTNYTRYDNNI